jgi:tetratricopeptide (TPR) repeat protein
MLGSFRFITVMALVTAAALMTTSTAAITQQSENLDKCLNKGDAFSVDARIGGCSALMQSNLTQKYMAYAFYDRGIAFQAKRDYDRAIADYTDAIRLEPNFAHAFYNRGTAYQVKRDYDHAIADYTDAIGLDPTYFRAYKARGHAFQAKGDNSRANSDLNEASRQNPNGASTTDALEVPPAIGTPRHQEEPFNFGFSPAWDCQNAGYGEPVCTKRR